MKVDPIITRVRQQDSGNYWGASGSRRVYGAADLAGVEAAFDGVVTPSAFIYLTDDSVDEEITGQGQQLNIDERFDIVVVLDNTADPRGHGAVNESQDARDNLIAALHGWEPGSGNEAVRYQGGTLASFDASKLLWVFTFETTRVVQ